MKIFECGNCSNPLFFENTKCENCGHFCGFSLTGLQMLTFSAATGPMVSDLNQQPFRYCRNQEYSVCNWLIPAAQEDEFCTACALNRTIPNLSDQENFKKWQKLEEAKHRLIYQLARLGLPLTPKMSDDQEGLCFDFVSNQEDQQVMTGHADGVITILLSEADSVQREQMRKQLSEPYRTLIGHFRHEVGHYYWDRLVASNQLEWRRFRKLFGDERADYGEALKVYYEQGAPLDWQSHHISAYATAHPWEDWAESWAHYLHIMDMAETSHFYGISVKPKLSSIKARAAIDIDPYQISKFGKIYKSWIPTSFAINSLNRSMGIPDAYPFVVSPAVIDKMAAIHRLVMEK